MRPGLWKALTRSTPAFGGSMSIHKIEWAVEVYDRDGRFVRRFLHGPDRELHTEESARALAASYRDATSLEETPAYRAKVVSRIIGGWTES